MANNQQLASDAFLSGSLAAGWTAWPNVTVPQVVVGSPNVIQPTGISTSNGLLWAGSSFPTDQITEVTVNNFSTSGTAQLILGARIKNVGGFAQGYVVVINPAAAIGNQVLLGTVSGGSFVQLSAAPGAYTYSAGDVWTFAVIGSLLTIYQNGARIAYLGNATYTSGNPAVQLTSNVTSATSVQVSSIRMYSAQQQDGIWTKQGCVLAPNSAELALAINGIAGLSVNFGPSVFLNPGNNVYRGYFVPQVQVNYAESLDGKTWVRYGSNPVIAGFGGGCVNWIGATAYMFGQASPGSSAQHFFTSSNGTTWTDHGVTTGLTVAGFSCYSICALTILGGNTFWGLFGGLTTGSGLAPVSFLATSPTADGLTWTLQNAGSPVLNSFCGCNMFQIASTYYLPGTSNQTGQGNATAPNFDPVYGVLYQSTNLTTWTVNGVLAQNSLYSDSLNNSNGGCAPLTIIDVAGTAYHYYQGSPADSTGPQDYQCMLATAPPGVSRATLVQNSQTATLQLASDNFASGPGPLPASWTTPAWSIGALQIIAGNLVEGNTTTGNRCVALYTGTNFSRNQYAEVTIQALTGGAGSFIVLYLLSPTTGNQQGYYVQIPSPSGTLTSGINFEILKLVNGVSTLLSTPVATANNITPHVNDVFRFAVNQGSDGSNVLTVYQNGAQVLMAQDYQASLTSGFPGMQINVITALTNVQIKSFAAGNTGVLPPGFGSTGWDNRQRKFVNKR